MSSIYNNTAIDHQLQNDAIPQSFQDPIPSLTQRQKFLVIPCPLTLTGESVFEAIDRTNTFWRLFEGHDQSENKITGEQAIETLRNGRCRGAVSTLLNRCTELPIEEAARDIEQCKAEVFFLQLVPAVSAFDLRQAGLEDALKKEGLSEDQRCEREGKLSRFKTTCEWLDAQKIHHGDYRWSEGQAVHSSTMITECNIFNSSEEYATTFNDLAAQAPPGAILQGTIDLLDHRMAFEYGPEKCYLFDAFCDEQSGLFLFPDKETFILAVREAVVETARGYLDNAMKKGITDQIRETFETEQVSFIVNSVKP